MLRRPLLRLQARFRNWLLRKLGVPALARFTGALLVSKTGGPPWSYVGLGVHWGVVGSTFIVRVDTDEDLQIKRLQASALAGLSFIVQRCCVDGVDILAAGPVPLELFSEVTIGLDVAFPRWPAGTLFELELHTVAANW